METEGEKGQPCLLCGSEGLWWGSWWRGDCGILVSGLLLVDCRRLCVALRPCRGPGCDWGILVEPSPSLLSTPSGPVCGCDYATAR